MTHTSTAREALARMDRRIEALTDARQRRWLTTFRDHWWAEAIGDVEAVMATMSHGPIRYSFDGNGLMAAESSLGAVDGYEKARAMYEGVAACGIRMAGTVDEERVLFDEHGLIVSCLLTAIYPGRFLTNADRPIDPDRFYLVQMPQIVGVFFDEQGLMMGEEIMNGAPRLIEPVLADQVGCLVDGPLPDCLNRGAMA